MMTNRLLRNLSSPPRLSDVFVWCDYIELRCLTHPDKTFSRSDLMETQEEMSDTREDANEIDDIEYASDFNLTSGESDENFFHQSVQAKGDRLYRITHDRFIHLSCRSRIFEDELYPFCLDDELQSISLKKELTSHHYLYLQLLISSTLRYCNRSRAKDLTGPFEEISLAIFKCLMPEGWEVFPFGKNKSSRYSGHLYDKLSKLADDIRGRLVTGKESFHEKDHGDGGLDLVAWHPMLDDRPLIPMAFAQCGCTPEEFEIKMLQASPVKLKPHLSVGHEWANYYFMPHSMHKSNDDEWQRYSDFGSAIVVDRLRIMRLALYYNVEVDELINMDVVEEALEESFC